MLTISRQQKPAPEFSGNGAGFLSIPWKKETCPMIQHPPNPIIIALLRKYPDGTLAPLDALPICRDLVTRLLRNPRDRQSWEALAYASMTIAEKLGGAHG